MIASLASAGRRWSEAEPEGGTGQGTASGAGGRADFTLIVCSLNYVAILPLFIFQNSSHRY